MRKSKKRKLFKAKGMLTLILGFMSMFVFAQTKTVTGTVVDEQGYEVIGVSVSVKGSATGTITDMDGKFSINASPKDVLLVRYVGYVEQSVLVGTQTNIRIVLQEDTQLLDEVVVVGYGTQKKSDVTGAMISVGEKELKSRPVSNAFEALQGKAAGVDITSNERPGEIGNINIRGVRSLTASNTPLYVVDGIPIMSSSGIETLNTNDIESIDILKDASATAIYGSRGANGVVLVTTKRGKEGRLTLNYTGTVTVENIQDRMKMMNSDEYITWRRWGYYYLDPNVYPRGDQPTQDNDYKIFLGANDSYAWNNIMKGWASGTWDGSKVATTDWTDMVTRTAISTEHNLSVSGGTDKMSAYGSFGYLNNQGTLEGQEYTRYTAKASIDVMATKWFRMGVTINGTYSLQQYGQSTTGGSPSGPNSIYAAANANLPYAVPYDDEGNRIIYPGGDDAIKTAIDEWKYTDDERQMFRAIGSVYAMLDIGNLVPAVKGLKYRMNFGPDFRYYRRGIFLDEESVNRNGTNYASKENQQDFSWTLDNLIYYDRTFGKHNLGATLLQSATKYNYEQTYLRAIDIPLASQKWNALSKANISSLDDWNSDMTEKQLLSYMGRINYSFDDKYLLTASGRWDGASQLAEGNKWAFFPSLALGWRLEQENFLKEVNWVSQLKLRLGMGTTGNSAIDPYQTKGAIVSLFYPYGNTAIPGYSASESLISNGNVAMANQDLTWERTTQYNLGVDFSFFKGRLSGILDVYTSKTKDLLMEMTIPALTGYTSTYANIGETSNVGFDLTLNTINVKTKDFEWSTSISAAWQKDKIDKLANGKEDDIVNGWFIGHGVGYRQGDTNYSGVIYNYASAGLWKEEDAAEMAKFNANGHSFQVGMARPVDQNGDYKIDPNDDRVIIGHTRPRWTVGMGNTFTYKSFEFSFFLSGRLDYTYDTGGEWQGGRYVQRSISYYNENNKNADYQKPIYNVAGGDPYYNILGYKDGSFIKLRNISLGYTLPVKTARQLGVNNLKVYVQAKNPGLLYSKIDWIDPDLGGSTWNRGYTFGLNIEF
ncbi:SusC/RagA family TonB-linked outer membrane protein [Dysgonomonas macrotermitis]|uniref:TonB-linked outer membrane protein, SusC/RagA family n=1 Tax=Dysgonomonas macrotermitis TaxID=1346286 RepID=A0A1M5BR21_9BACT|nr:TonB-linked outer membrane protein, SusC/RagA family [Dysgonomonas macrotermitis]